MSDDASYLAPLTRFLKGSAFATRGAVVTDLDGTAVHEIEGRAHISPTVEAGLEAIHAAGRQVLVDTMRFPQSVIRVFGAQWYRISGAAIPLVSLNGSQIGLVRPGDAGALVFEELGAVPLDAAEIDEIMDGVRGLVSTGLDELLVFHYPRDWREGERIWSPRADRVDAIAAKYRSASRVFSSPVDALAESLHADPMCMLFLLVDAPEDRLMAYQHTQITRFVTHAGVDKRAGAVALAERLGISLPDSIGAGDAPADNFLDAVGLAVIVGDGALDYRGRQETIRIDQPATFGRMLIAIAAALR